MIGTTDQRPVFVYGTLRPGQPNWDRLLAGRSERVVPGRLRGAVVLDCGHYPAVVERAGDGAALGDVAWIRATEWPAVLVALDHLEGYDPDDPAPLFERVIRQIETASGPVDCWVYLAGRELAESALPLVAGGDWAAHCASVPAYREHWEKIAETGGRAPRRIGYASPPLM